MASPTPAPAPVLPQQREIWPGTPTPLGATFDGRGTNFSLFSSVAERVELCLFPEAGNEERIELTEIDGHQWHSHLVDVGPGTAYGFRVHGPWDPDSGRWCNPSKLLLDPYARAISGDVQWDPACFGYDFSNPDLAEGTDSAPFVPRSLVTNPWFDWSSDRRPDIPLEETVIYEAHVKGLTQLHPDVPEHQRGTYSGLAHPAVISHLLNLGVTAVELLPVHHFLHDNHLVERGRRNYWGYNSIGFLAPYSGYRSVQRPEDVASEFKQMVMSLHDAGLEVILDVVYNHTAEGNQMGPTLSFRGIDHPAYFRLVEGDERYLMDYTGTGNTLNMRHPHVLQLMMDSLRYWVTDMHVDGFRFDLAATLARELHDVDRLSSFFDLIQQDPIVSSVKLIAEPWDIGDGGYQVGNFPPYWSEWNGRYRDTVRSAWSGQGGVLGDLGTRLAGSSDLYQSDRGSPTCSINFITAHDGFTMEDLVTYDHKHNDDNGEDGRDGSDDNRSWNCGAEGPTDDPEIQDLRARQVRNLMATLLLSQGVPMIVMGDESRRTQHGNNNAYSQDNEISWLDWDLNDPRSEHLEFTRRLTELRRAHPSLRRRRWMRGPDTDGGGDVSWWHPEGRPFSDGDWEGDDARQIGIILEGTIAEPDRRGRPIVDQRLALLVDTGFHKVTWTLPEPGTPDGWVALLDTAEPSVGTARAMDTGGGDVAGLSSYVTDGRRIVLLSDGRP